MWLLFCLIVPSVFFVIYIIARVTLVRCYCDVCLVGKTAIVTGANSGLGFGTALKLASRGCRVILAIRSDLESTKAKIITETHNPNIVVRYLDLSSFSSVRKFAKEINETEPCLDILINNAGIGISSLEQTEDGLDPVFQVNYYGAFLLTHLLIDLLRKTAPSRIIFNNSSFAFLTSFTRESFPGVSKKYGSIAKLFFAYGNTKLLLAVASKVFAQKLRGTGVTSNSCHPGWVKTPLFKRLKSALGTSLITITGQLLTNIYGRSLDDGLHTIVHLALSNDLKEVSGKFFIDCKPFFQPPLVKDDEFCNKVWKYSEEIVGLKSEEKITS